MNTNQMAAAMLAQTRPDEFPPLARGPAKCRSLDEQLVDQYMARYGRRGNPLTLLEATIFATRAAVYYITPRINNGFRWVWADEVLGVELGKRKGMFQQAVNLRMADGVLTIFTRKTTARTIAVLGQQLITESGAVRRDYEAHVRSGSQTLRERQGIPVSEWDDCAYCSSTIEDRTDHVAGCRGCPYYFSDPGFEPVISTEPEEYGRLVGEKEWMPLFESHLPFRDKTLAWAVRPPDVTVGPDVLVSSDLMKASVSE